MELLLGLTLLEMFLFGFGFAVAIKSFPYIKSFFLWIKGGIENGDGVLQNKDIQIAVFSAIGGMMVVSLPILKLYGIDFSYPDIVWIVVFTAAGVTSAIDAYRNVETTKSTNGNGNGNKSKQKIEDESEMV